MENQSKNSNSFQNEKNNSIDKLNQSKSEASLNKSVLNKSIKDEVNQRNNSQQNAQGNQSINNSQLNESQKQFSKNQSIEHNKLQLELDENQEINDDQIIQQPQQQKEGYTISEKSWELNAQEVKFLNELYGEIQEAQLLAEGLQQETKFQDEQFEQAEKDIDAMKNVIDVLNEESDKEDDIRFAIDNALLTLATTKRKTEDENEKLRDLIRERNHQLRLLVIKVKEQDKEIKKKDEQIKKFDQQVTSQAQTIRQLQNKVDDDHRIKIIQEQLRKPRENKLYDETKFIDSNAKDDPFDFWQNNAMKEYPGEPKKLNDVIQKKGLWVQQKEDTKLNKFEYQKLPKSNELNFWGS